MKGRRIQAVAAQRIIIDVLWHPSGSRDLTTLTQQPRATRPMRMSGHFSSRREATEPYEEEQQFLLYF